MKYWEDFAPGERLELGAREVSREEIVGFAQLYDPQPFHLDEAAAQESLIGRLCASGWHICAMFARMSWDGEGKAGALLGLAEIEECRWRRPVFPGDALSLSRECLERKIDPADSGAGLCRFRWEIADGSGEVKAQLTGWQKIRRREAERA